MAAAGFTKSGVSKYDDRDMGCRRIKCEVGKPLAQQAQIGHNRWHPGITPILTVARDDSRDMTVVVMPFLSRVTLFDIISLHATPDDPGAPGLRMEAIDQAIRTRNAAVPCPLRDPSADQGRRRIAFSEWIAEIGAALADVPERRGRVTHLVTGDPLAYEHTAGVIGGVDGEMVRLEIEQLLSLRKS